MADGRMAFVKRLRQRGGSDFWRSRVESVLADLMAYQESNKFGAELHERSGARRFFAVTDIMDECCMVAWTACGGG